MIVLPIGLILLSKDQYKEYPVDQGYSPSAGSSGTETCCWGSFFLLVQAIPKLHRQWENVEASPVPGTASVGSASQAVGSWDIC